MTNQNRQQNLLRLSPILVVILLFAAMVAVEFALPERTDRPQSPVAIGANEEFYVPDEHGQVMSCTEWRGFNPDIPTWDCPNVRIDARTGPAVNRNAANPSREESLKRAFRGQLGQPSLPSGPVEETAESVLSMRDGDQIAIGIFDTNGTAYFFFEGAAASTMATRLGGDK